MDIAKYFIGVKLDSSIKKSMYFQIADNIADKIKNHILQPGAKLPAERDLAEIFGVSRTTAINAYRLLEQWGLVRTRVGSGTYVTEQPVTNSENEVPWPQLFRFNNQSPASSVLNEMVSTNYFSDSISFTTGMPDPGFYPVKTFVDLFNRRTGDINKADFGYIPTEGYEPLRRSVAEMLTAKGIPALSEDIMIVSGAQQGIYLLSKVLLEPGDYVVTESPTFIGAIQAFQSAGAKILSVDMSNSNSLLIIEDYIIRYRPKMLYIMPTFQNPSGGLMSLKKRQQLLELAARHRLVIVEDDPYRELYYDELPPPTLKALDSYGGVVHLGTFSKILTPGLKIGYVAASPVLIKQMALEKQYIDLNSNNFTQWLIHAFLEEGKMDNHLSFIRKEYKRRRDAMAKALKRYCEQDVEFHIPDGGYYFWCKLREAGTASKLLHEAIKNGVSFVPGDVFYTTPTQGKEFRLCFVTHNEDVLVEGIRRLGKALGFLRKGKKGPSTSTVPIPPLV